MSRGSLPSGIVTFLLTDIEGSTALWERAPEVMAVALERHDALVDEHVGRRHGFVIKSKGEGDSTLSVFRRVTDAAAAAGELQHAMHTEPWPEPVAMRVRMALHTGEAFERAGDYFGPPVNRAARLRGIAIAGQIVVSEVSATLLRDQPVDQARLVDLGLRQLRGLSREERVFSLEPTTAVAIPPAARVALPVAIELSLPGPLATGGTPLTDRTDELGLLEAAFGQAGAGQLQVAFLAGEAGIGKTRLVAELAARVHGAGSLVLYGRCDEDMVVPYQPFVEALRPSVSHIGAAGLETELPGLAGDLGALFPQLARAATQPGGLRSDPDVERHRLFEAVTTLLARVASHGPALLVLDDLHWSDTPTVLLLRTLVRNATDSPMLVLGTYRDLEVEHDSAFADLLQRLDRDGTGQRVALRGLTSDDAADFARRFLRTDVPDDLASALATQTNGNPFFMSEVLRLARDTHAPFDRAPAASVLAGLGLPEGVRELVARRVSRLPDDVQRTLSLASVVGPEFGVNVLTRAADLPGDAVLQALDRARSAGLIHEVADRAGHYTFSHTLIRQTLYAEIGPARRLRFHDAVGNAIEATSDPESSLGALAQHFAHAAPIEGTEKAVDYCIRAGRRAFADLAFEDAVEHFRRGLTLLDEHGPPDAGLRTELLVSLADTLMYTDQIAGQNAALDAADAARRSGSAAQFARALLSYSRVSAPAALVTGHDPVLAGLLEEALPLLGDDEPTLRAQLLARRAFYSATFGLRMPDRLPVAEEALRLARTSDDPITLGDALFAVVACVAGSPDAADRRRMGEELVELGERNRAPRPWTFGLRVLARTHLELGDATAFDDAVTALADVGTDLRWVPAQAHAAQWRTAQAAAAGRFDDARVFSQELVRHGRVNRGFIAIYGSQLLHLLLEQGGIVDPADIEQRVSVQPENASLRATAAHLHLECGDAGDARRHLAVLATDGFVAAAAEPSSPSTLARLAEVAVAVDATDSCAALAGHLEPFRGTLVVAEHFGSLGAADRYLAMLAAALGHEADADAGFEQALSMEERAGAWALVPRTRYWQARAQTGRDDVFSRQLARRAAAEADELGMERLQEQAAGLLAGA